MRIQFTPGPGYLLIEVRPVGPGQESTRRGKRRVQDDARGPEQPVGQGEEAPGLLALPLLPGDGRESRQRTARANRVAQVAPKTQTLRQHAARLSSGASPQQRVG